MSESKKGEGARQGKFREVLKLLREAGEPSTVCYARLRQAKMRAPLASNFKLLLESPAQADAFLAGKAWDEAVEEARAARPGSRKRTLAQQKQQKARHFAKLLRKVDRTEYIHPLGVFRLVRVAGGLGAGDQGRQKD